MGTRFFIFITPAPPFFTKALPAFYSSFRGCCRAGTAQGTFHWCESGAQEGGRSLIKFSDWFEMYNERRFGERIFSWRPRGPGRCSGGRRVQRAFAVLRAARAACAISGPLTALMVLALMVFLRDQLGETIRSQCCRIKACWHA